MDIRTYRDGDLLEVVRCFTDAVRVIAARYYQAEQVEAWAPLEPDLISWRKRLSRDHVLVAELQASAIGGFVRVEQSGLIDLLYVHPTYERRGIGSALLHAACSWAEDAGAQRFEANVSLAARRLFEAGGFRVQREQQVEYRGFMFRNFHMARDLVVAPAASQAVAADGER
jgi:putative acetyltransferase